MLSPVDESLPPAFARRSANGRGLVWTEFLAVAALLSILGVLLAPVVARARARAAQGECVSNLRQLAAATRLYLSDNDDTFPFAWKQNAQGDDFRTWFTTLAPYLASARRIPRENGWEEHVPAFHCPADSSGQSAYVSYATNALVAGADDGRRLTRARRMSGIARPEAVVWLGETNKLWHRGDGFYDTPTDWVRPEYDLGVAPDSDDAVAFYHRWLKERDWSDLRADALDCPDGLFQCKYPAFRHDRSGLRTGFANFLFVDGHVHAYHWGALDVENFFPRLTPRQARRFVR